MTEAEDIKGWIKHLHEKATILTGEKEEAAIQRVIKERRITHLVHFTRAKNLPAIFEYGLVPKSFPTLIEGREINNGRDGNLDAICVSIIYVSDMFVRMMRAKKPPESWCVVILKPDILWKKDCVFFPINAVSRVLRNNHFYSHGRFFGADGLENMFASEVMNPYHDVGRRAGGLLKNMPTNPQAEVHIKGVIETSYIHRILFHKEFDKRRIAEYNFPDGIGGIISNELFDKRENWLKSEGANLKWLKDQFS